MNTERTEKFVNAIACDLEEGGFRQVSGTTLRRTLATAVSAALPLLHPAEPAEPSGNSGEMAEQQGVDGVEKASIELWHRFANEGAGDWSDEIHKAEYRLAAKAVIHAWLRDVRITQEMLDAGLDALLAYRKSGGDYKIHPSHATEAAIKAALAATGKQQVGEKCVTCSDRGWVGGPTFSDPAEGGMQCPDCNALDAHMERYEQRVGEVEWVRDIHDVEQGLIQRTIAPHAANNAPSPTVRMQVGEVQGDARTQFEAWAHSESLSLHKSARDGEYNDARTISAWLAWQAALAARQPQTREALIALAREAIRQLDVIDGHIDAAVEKCRADIAARQPGDA